MAYALLQLGGGFVESVGQVAAVAGALVLVLVLVAFGAFAYKSLWGGGVEWPDEDADDSDDGVTTGGDDDEWDYY